MLKINRGNTKGRKHEIINILFRVFKISCFRDKISYILETVIFSKGYILSKEECHDSRVGKGDHPRTEKHYP